MKVSNILFTYYVNTLLSFELCQNNMNLKNILKAISFKSSLTNPYGTKYLHTSALPNRWQKQGRSTHFWYYMALLSKIFFLKFFSIFKKICLRGDCFLLSFHLLKSHRHSTLYQGLSFKTPTFCTCSISTLENETIQPMQSMQKYN